LISVVGDVRGDRGRVDDDKEEEDELDADEAVLEEVEDER
jgi:hypothetical protein